MGAPVITKAAGNSYVSRMSTAVLGRLWFAREWIAVDESSYVQLAVEQAANLVQLRANPLPLA